MIHIKIRAHIVNLLALLCTFVLLAGCQNNTSEVEMSSDISSSITESQSSQTNISQSEESSEILEEKQPSLYEIDYKQSINTIPLDCKERTVKVRFVNSAGEPVKGLYVTARFYHENGTQVVPDIGYRLEPTEVQTDSEGEITWTEFEKEKYAVYVKDSLVAGSNNNEVYCLDLSDGGSNIYEFLWEHE